MARKKKPPLKLEWLAEVRKTVPARVPRSDRALVMAVALVRAEAADSDGTSTYESQETVGRAVGAHRTTVAKADEILVALGLFEHAPPVWPKKKGYTLTLLSPQERQQTVVAPEPTTETAPVVAPVVGTVVGPKLADQGFRDAPPTSEGEGGGEEAAGDLTVAANNGNPNGDELRKWFRRVTVDWEHLDSSDVDWSNRDLAELIGSLPYRWDLLHRLGCLVTPPKTPVKSATGWLLAKLRKNLTDLTAEVYTGPPPIVSPGTCEQCGGRGADRLVGGEWKAHKECVRAWLKTEKEHQLETTAGDLADYLTNVGPEWRPRLQQALESGDLNVMTPAVMEYESWQVEAPT